MELGPLAMRPFVVPDVAVKTPIYVFPKFEAITHTLQGMGVPPDFEADSSFRYVHRRAKEMDLYFVSNRTGEWHGAHCAFRISGRAPELWNPISGEIRQQLMYEVQAGRTILPLWLEPYGSLFVVFRKGSGCSANDRIIAVTQNGRSDLPSSGAGLQQSPAFEIITDQARQRILRAWQPGCYEVETASHKHTLDATSLPDPVALAGPWHVSFASSSSAAVEQVFDKLLSWSEHREEYVRHFSGSALYRMAFDGGMKFKEAHLRWYLDVGRVAVMAEVKLNGQDLGVLWKAPYRVDITSALRPGDNQLEVKVTNGWVNRMIGDEALAEDSERNADGTCKQWPVWVQENKASPTGRFTFTSWRLWKKGDPLVESGLLGPVKLLATKEFVLP